MIIIEKQVKEDYENAQSYRLIVDYEYGFERVILEKHLSQALEESKNFLRKLTKGEDNNGK